MDGATTRDVTGLATAFEAYLARRRRAPGTRVKYTQVAREFAAWAGDTPFGAVTASDIEFGFLGDWHAGFTAAYGRGPSPRTVRNHLLLGLAGVLDRRELGFADRALGRGQLHRRWSRVELSLPAGSNPLPAIWTHDIGLRRPELFSVMSGVRP